MSSAASGLKTALRYNGLSGPAQLIALGERQALRLPMVGPKVWAEAKKQAALAMRAKDLVDSA